MSETPQVQPGMCVRTFDGRRIGHVRAAEPGRLLVDRRWGSPYWMPDTLVRSVKPECATLHIDHRVVPRYRQPAVPPSSYRSKAGLRASMVGGTLAGLLVGLVALL